MSNTFGMSYLRLRNRWQIAPAAMADQSYVRTLTAPCDSAEVGNVPPDPNGWDWVVVARGLSKCIPARKRTAMGIRRSSHP